MNEELLDDATIRLLKVLGEYTPDVEINDAVHTMTLAGVRIQRLQSEIDHDGWNKIEDNGLPEEGRWYDAFTWTREGHRTVRELFFDGVIDGAVYWLGDGDWPYPVTHWKERTEPPINE